jgi:hypothetical protein
MKIKLIDLLREDAEADKAASSISNAMQQDVPGFVKSFKDISSDPKVQAVLKAGLGDGDLDDEKLPYTEENYAVNGLIPTQSEIGFNQSIQNLLTDKFGSLQSIFDGMAKVGGPIVTYNGKYIIDGHHRWSQVFAANPEAKMQCLNITGGLHPKEILKIVHAAIVLKLGSMPSADPKGINILKGISLEQVKEAVKTYLSENAAKIWANHGQKDIDAIANYLYVNLKKLIKNNPPIANAPGRADMPQTDAEDKDIPATLNYVKKGVVNFISPQGSDADEVKEAKRLKKLAGL